MTKAGRENNKTVTYYECFQQCYQNVHQLIGRIHDILVKDILVTDTLVMDILVTDTLVTDISVTGLFGNRTFR